MNALVMLFQDHAAEPNVFAFSESVSFWTIVIFLLLLAVLAKFAFPPILGYAAAREQRIQQSLDEAKAAGAEAERLLALQRQELAAARQEAQQIVAESRQAAERVRDDLLVRSRAEQAELIERAKQEIVMERDRAIESMRREAVDLALAAAGRLLERRLGAEEDRKLVTDYLGRVAGGVN